jgi:hypothetical protein
VPEEQRRHDQRDQTEDEVGLTEVAALEPRRSLHLADEEGRCHPDEHQDAEHVDEEEEPALVAEPRQRPLAVDGGEERHHDGREQDEEAPEDERVHQARPEPLQELPLAQDDRRLGTRPPADVAGAARRLPEPHDAVEQVRAAEEEAACDGEHDGEREARRERAHDAARIAAEIAGRISCRSPITA